MKALEELYYLVGRLEGLKEKEFIDIKEIDFIYSILNRNEYFHDLPKVEPKIFKHEPKGVKDRNKKVSYDGPEAYGYSSWSEMSLHEAFEGDTDAFDDY